MQSTFFFTAGHASGHQRIYQCLPVLGTEEGGGEGGEDTSAGILVRVATVGRSRRFRGAHLMVQIPPRKFALLLPKKQFHESDGL